MSGLKESVKVNIQGAILGVQEESFSFAQQFKLMPPWKQFAIISVLIAIIPVYLAVRFGTEQFLTQKYGRLALSAHSAFTGSMPPTVGNITIVRNPNNTFSGIVLVTNPNLDLSATGIEYTATFSGNGKSNIATMTGTLYLLPNEKKYVVIPRIESTDTVSSGTLTLDNVKWQKKLDIPNAKLRATEPILYDESNPLTFIAEGAVINDSPYEIGTARTVFILYDDQNKIIGVSQRDDNRLLPFGRRAYKQLWPGLYASQVKKVQVIPVTNTLDPLNITIDPSAPPKNSNSNSNADAF